MSSVIVVTPLIIAGWPVVTAAVTAAISSLGFSMIANTTAATVKQKVKTIAEIDVEDSEILQETASTGGEIVVERDGVRCVFTRDTRGSLKLCVEGEGQSKAELKKIGEELLGRVTQQYVYHRIVTELQDRHMTIVDEEVGVDRTVKLRVRNL